MKILLLSYSFGAWRGSEAGVGWNVARGLSERGHDVTVVTTSEFADINHRAIADTGLSLRLEEWDFGLTRFAEPRSYYQWQHMVGSALQQLCGKERFDVAHHITFNQYRGIRDVFATGLPYVIGPVGGADTVAVPLLRELPWRAALKEVARYIPWDVLPLARCIRQSPQPNVLMASTLGTWERLRRTGGLSEAELYPIIAVGASEISDKAPERASPPYILFDGGLRPEKGLWLLLRVFGRLWESGVRIRLSIAAVPEKGRPAVEAYAARCGLPSEAVEVMPFVPREQMLQKMRGAKVFVTAAFRDSGCMALLEALAMGVSCLCLDTGGQHWLPEELALKVPVTSHVESDLLEALHQLVLAPPRDADWHARRAQWLRTHMTWDARLDHLEDVYRRVCAQGECCRESAAGGRVLQGGERPTVK